MKRVTIDRATVAKLEQLREKVEFCDEFGGTLGYFQPTPERDRDLYKDVEIPPLSEEELRRCEQEIAAGKFYTIDEVLAHLKSLEKP